MKHGHVKIYRPEERNSGVKSTWAIGGWVVYEGRGEAGVAGIVGGGDTVLGVQQLLCVVGVDEGRRAAGAQQTVRQGRRNLSNRILIFADFRSWGS